ncbi:MAG: cell envelope biogenesis protein OmpA, partial [Treponema sp.]|nr:cell envelope biogenesis protein OmpA [Treponema sp.]
MKTLTNKAYLFLAIFLITTIHFAHSENSPPFRDGADAVPDLYSAALAGAGSFSTSTGGATVSAVNPAQGGDANRMIFDASFLGIAPILPGDASGNMTAVSLGALFPTRFGVFGGSMRFIGGLESNRFDHFPIHSTFGGNLFAAREVYPGMSVGAGLNFGFGYDWTLSADIGFRYNMGRLAFLDNFTWAFVMRGLGKSYFPTWLTPMGGVSFDLWRIDGTEGRRDPLVLNLSADISFPALFFPVDSDGNFAPNVTLKTGMNLTIAEIVTLSVGWPSASGLNAQELRLGTRFPAIPSIGLCVNIMLPSGGERIAGGRLPSDGDLRISTAFRPLYEGITAVGAGVSWYVGITDTNPPVIRINYPEVAHFSPNHSGINDVLEIPVSITDEGFVTSWMLEIKDENDNIIRVIENAELRFTSFNFQDFFRRIVTPKSHIDVPDVLVWNGIRDDGSLAPDGRYFFRITATDDSDNTAETQWFETVLRITPPVISITDIPASQRIFDPTGEGGRPSITFYLSGSEEEAWESGMYNVAGERVRTFEVISGQPHAITWDGRNDAGVNAPDGVYTFRVSATCRAQTFASAQMANIILDSRDADVFLTTSVSHIAPAPNQTAGLVYFNIRLSMQDGIENWRLELVDETGTVQRTFTDGTQVPQTINWNGLTQAGIIREGIYTPRLTVVYTRGDVITATATTVVVDVSGPALTLRFTPEYFSPDNDGFNDELFIYLSAIDASPIATWSLE